MKRYYYIALSIAIATSSLLMTACGNKNETVSAMNNVSTEKESVVESSTEIESSIEIETETQSVTEPETQDETETQSETETQDETETRAQIKSTEEQVQDLVNNRYKHEVSTSTTTYTTTPITETMYATIDAYTYEGPDIDSYEIKAAVQKGEEIKVIGKVKEADWYEIEQEGGIKSFISGDFLTSTDPNPAPVTTTQPNQNNQSEGVYGSGCSAAGTGEKTEIVRLYNADY